MYKDLSLCGLAAKVAEVKRALILFHARPDADAAGAAFALADLIRDMGGAAHCLCSDPLPRRLAFLAAGEQESVTADSLPEGFSEGASVISVDSAAPSQLGGIFETFRPMLMIDHHAVGERYADGYVDPSAAATGEIIFSLAKELLETGKLPCIRKETAERLYAAISSDTGGFRYSNTTAKTYRTAAELLSYGIDIAEINRRLFESKSPSSLRALRLGLEKMSFACGGRVCFVAVSADEIEKEKIEKPDCDMFIEAARSAEGVAVAFSVRSDGNSCRVSMRTDGSVDAAALCAAFGGGGHTRAAGCGFAEKDVDAVARAVLEEVERRLP